MASRGKGRSSSRGSGRGRSSGGGGRGGGSAAGLILIITQEGDVVDANGAKLTTAPYLDKTKKAKVRWHNQADRGYTLTFEYWPFKEPEESIKIADGKKSGWFRVYPEATSRNYGYIVSPTIGTPPDPPSLNVGP